MLFNVYAVTETTPSTARKSADGTLWLCHSPENAPAGVTPLQTLTYEEALALIQTAAWAIS